MTEKNESIAMTENNMNQFEYPKKKKNLND